MANTFTQALVAARRRAQLQGRPLSQQETVGIAQGEANVADERAARLRALKIEEEQNARTNALAERRLAEETRSREFELQRKIDADREAREFAAEQERKGAYTSTGASLGGIIGTAAGTGTAVGGPLGGAIGALGGLVFGAFAGGSHLCTEACKVLCKVDDLHMSIFRAFRKFMHENYPRCLGFYLRIGPEIINGIRAAHPTPDEYVAWWEGFYTQIIHPMLHANPDDPSAYKAYMNYVQHVLIPTYAPNHEDMANWLVTQESVKEVG